MSFVRNGLRYIQHHAHENPVYVWSLGIGAVGPLLVVTVPPIRKNLFGWVPDERVPTTYPLPQRARASVSGYDDPEPGN